jgi:predicted dinucleotide-binding enzyme
VERVPGAELVKAFNQLPLKIVAIPLPEDLGRWVVFVSSERWSELQSYSG